MELWLMWVVAGFVLVIAELLSGTFYLLVVGLGAFAGAVVAYLGGNELVSAVLACAIALVGAFFVHSWHVRNRNNVGHKGDNFLDRGQSVVLEGWVDETARIARVRYRGAWWDARLREDLHPAPGSTLYIESQDGNMLVVASAPPQ
jgi:membrane protein implicated in regulation of membrane protease activity